MSQLDEAVVKLASAPRDTKAWEQLFILTWPYVLALAHRYLRGPRHLDLADAEDLAQEVFLKLARAWHARQIEVRDGNSLRTLLAVMTRRLAIDSVRSQHRLRRDFRKEVPAPVLAEPAEISPGMSEVEWGDLLRMIARQLTEDERRILEMRLEGYEVTEIATRLDVATRTVERRLARIRKLLQRHVNVDG